MTTIVYVAPGADHDTLRLVQELRIRSEELGINVVVRDNIDLEHNVEPPAPRVIVIGALRYFFSGGYINPKMAMFEALQRNLDIIERGHLDAHICGSYTPKRMDMLQFGKIRQAHAMHSRLQIQRFGKNPRVVKHFRKQGRVR